MAQINLQKVSTANNAPVGKLGIFVTPDNEAFLIDENGAVFAFGGGAGSFLALSDTPVSYVGQVGKSVRVNVAENALEFYDPATSSFDGNPSSLNQEGATVGQAIAWNGSIYAPTTIEGTGETQIITNQDFDYVASNTVTLDFIPDGMLYVGLNGQLTDRWTRVGDQLTVSDWVSGFIIVGYWRNLIISNEYTAGAGLSLTANEFSLGDSESVFFTPISAPAAKDAVFRLLGGLEIDAVDGTQSTIFEAYNTGSYPRLNFLGTLTGGVGDTLTSAIRAGQASGRSEFYSTGSHASGREAGFSYDVRDIANLATGDGIEMFLSNAAGNLLRLFLSGNGATYSAVFLDDINNKGIEYAADYSANFTDRSLPDKAYVDGYFKESALLESNTIPFDKNYIIGNAGARTGNILFDFTNAKLGATAVMRHQDAGAFTFPATAQKLSGTYDGTVDNYIWFVLMDKTAAAEVVHYTISQVQP